MSKHEIFDDSLFAALMDELCEDQGQELMEECALLNGLDEFENEEERLARGEETIDRELQRLRRQRRRVTALRSVRVLSIAALAVLVVGLASYMTIPQFQSRVQAALNIEPEVTSGTVIINNGNASGNEVRPPEEYEEVQHTYEYTEDGIVEIITYRHPETGDEYVVRTVTEYPEYSYDKIVIPPPSYEVPKMTEGNYIHGGIPGYNGYSSTPNGSSSLTGGNNPTSNNRYGYGPTSIEPYLGNSSSIYSTGGGWQSAVPGVTTPPRIGIKIYP